MWFQVNVLKSIYLVYIPWKFWKICIVKLNYLKPEDMEETW
jgi:hypothetical protein